MTAPIVKVMVANKLPATVLAQVFLLVIAGFAVSLYILPTATGTANGILSFHTSNIPCLRCFLFAPRLPAYILGHHQKNAGDDTAVKAIIDSVPTNGYLEPATPKNKDGAGKKKPAHKAGGGT